MNTDIEKRMKDLSARWHETRKNVLKVLREIDRRQIWEKCGFRSLREYLIKALRYDESEARDILIELGHIIPSENMTDPDPKAQNRIERLKAWRTEEARRTSTAPYLILANRTLLNLARQNPKNMAELHKIHGIGEAKLKTFGRRILKVLGQ